jgi:hypothetical protein
MNLITRLRGTMKRPHLTKADTVAKVSDFLKGPTGASIVLPLLPDTGSGVAGIEFAAASVVERVILGALVRQLKPQRIFEIGTFRGLTALSMASNCTWESVLWTLDLPPDLTAKDVNERFYAANPGSGFGKLADANIDRAVGAALRGYSGPCRVEQLFGDAKDFDFSPYTPVDLFFVDGCHQYAEAKRDTLIAWKALRSGGRLVWHDYTWSTVEKAAREALPGQHITWIGGTSLAFADKP